MKQTKFRIKSRATRSRKSKYIVIIFALLLLAGAVTYYIYTKNRSLQTDGPSNTNTKISKSVSDQEDVVPEEKQNVPEDTDAVIEDYKFVTENEQFKIRQLEDEYVVTLYPIINRPDQRDMYLDQLREYKQAALDYLRVNELDTTRMKVIFEPNEAQNL